MLKRLRPRSLMIAFSFLSVLILMLSACGAPTPGTSPPSGGTPVKGGTWTDDLYEEPNSLITNGSVETYADIVDQTIYAPLFYGDPQGKINPGLTTVVPTIANGGVSADAKTWTFHLRTGLKWSDGQPLDARDVDFTWKLWTNPKFTPASTVGFNLITSADVSPDNLSITFHLKQAFSPFVSIWTDSLEAPLPMHHFQSIAPDKVLTSPDNLNPSVTSGPFMMKESKPGDHYTVVRNPNYYQASAGLPYLDSIVFRIVPNQDTILKDVQAGSVNSSWFVDVTKSIAYKRISNYTLTGSPYSANFEAMYFNFHNKILGQHPEVRQAMAMAIDHQALIDTARRGLASPLCTDHSKGFNPGYQADAPCPKFDPAAANALLDQNGWVKGADGYRSKGTMKLDFQYSTTANNLWRADDELILQSNFKAIGIKLEIQNYPASTFFGPFLTGGNASPPTGAVSGRYDIGEFENSWTYDPDDATLLACNQIPPNGFNINFYCNPQLDKLFIQEESTADPAARQQVFNQEHQIYLTEYPFVTLYAPPDLAVHKNIGHNFNPGPMGAQEDNEVWLWWCEGGKC
jgi:peptide/nickel transport system substrate-binding protein